MNLQEAVTSAIHNYANFSGRARRSEFWWFNLCVVAVSIVLESLAAGLHSSLMSGLMNGLTALFGVAVLVPGLALIWRRLHDTGRSGAMFLCCLIPLVGWILVLVWFCQDSQPGDNQYGPNPKEEELV
ncbi:MAG: DUF805 domain-containing protein [Ruminococcaceae bacterium]|nr:DUF805 domain-containing protein [Oscillospiraceae bacterium]